MWCCLPLSGLRYSIVKGIGFEREDVDADGGILFLEEGDLFGLDGIIYSSHVECGFVTGII